MKMGIGLILLLGILLTLWAKWETTQESEAWEASSRMPTPRSEMPATLYKEYMYVAGGMNFWGTTDKFERYQLNIGKWEKLPDMPLALNHIGLAALGEKIYVSGGFTDMIQKNPVKTLYAYDLETGKWETLSEMPAPRAAHFMVAINDTLHLFGGSTGQKEVWSYIPATDSWSSSLISPLPEPRDHINILTDKGTLYLVGGRSRGQIKADCWRYDSKTQAWSVFTQIPQPRGGQTACLFNNKIHITGGEDLQKGVAYSNHETYDLSTNTWSELPGLPTKRHGLGSVLYQGKWYVVGGGRRAGLRTWYSASNLLEVYTLD